MIRTFGPHKVFLCVLSTQRSENVGPMTRKVGPATWVVPREEHDRYQQAGVANIVTDGGKNVARARNVALYHARRLRLPCLQLDDDLVSIRMAVDGRAIVITFSSCVRILTDALLATPYKLAATNVVTNATFVKSPVSQNKTINGGMLLVLPTKLRFDPQQAVSEDIDYALQHHEAYGGYLRLDCLMTQFKHRQPGGVQVYRDLEWDRKGTQMLQEKWGEKVKPRHSKDNPHHVIVSLPPAEALPSGEPFPPSSPT